VSPALIYRFQTGTGVSGTRSPSIAGEEAMSGSSLFMAGFVWGGLAFAQNGISVRVCNSVHMPGRILDQARGEASFVLETGGLEVTWLDCSTETMEQTLGPLDFVLCLVAFRLSGGVHPGQRVLGSTSIANRTQQNYVFVHYDSIAKIARDHGAEWQAYQILGYSIAHELGHLLLGGEHTRRGVMRAVWGPPDLLLMSKREIKFTEVERERIQQALEARVQAWPNN
jgi:hypothetical protein